MYIAILSFYSGHFERGVENWTKELSERIAKRHNVSVFQSFPEVASNYKIIYVPVKIDINHPIERQGIFKRAFLDYWSLKIFQWTTKILPIIWKEKPQIVIPTNGGWQVALIRIVTWLYGGKMVIVGHSGKGWDERNNIWSFPDKFVALTVSTKRWVKSVNPFVKVEMIPDGVDLAKFDATGPTSDVALSKPIVLAVGALEKSKRFDLTIEAVSRMKNTSLLILGKGAESEKLEKLGKDKLGKRFMIKSAKYDEMPRYYRACDVFTMPSQESEAFGMVYIEAMACGLPVVATNDPVRKEIVGDAGILVDPTDIDEYSKALEKALTINWGDKPRLQAKKFSWQAVVEKYESLFSSLVE